MSLLWPWVALALLLVPLLVAAYIWMLRRKRRFAVRYSSLSLIRAALPKHAQWRRHVPFALLMLAVTSLITAMARPASQVQVPLNQASIILAMDVSRSMCATDVEPNRLTVAQEAALAFVDDQIDGTQIGIVAFTGFAQIVVPPTSDKEVLRNAISGFTTSIGTAIGSAILKSLDAIAEINDQVAPSGVNLQAAAEGAERSPLAQLNPGDDGYQPDIVVLLTDGANSQGPLPLDAAQQAADRRVRVYTVGFGTQDPGEMRCTREQLGGNPFGPGGVGGGNFGGGFFGGGGGGFRQFLLLDEETLRGVADLTGGDYFEAENAEQLLDVFLNLPSYVVLQTKTTEISVIFAALGATLALAAVGLSLRWNRFP